MKAGDSFPVVSTKAGRVLALVGVALVVLLTTCLVAVGYVMSVVGVYNLAAVYGISRNGASMAGFCYVVLSLGLAGTIYAISGPALFKWMKEGA